MKGLNMLAGTVPAALAVPPPPFRRMDALEAAQSLLAGGGTLGWGRPTAVLNHFINLLYSLARVIRYSMREAPSRGIHTEVPEHDVGRPRQKPMAR
ncbi:hypothetical protein IAQ61_001752 [Plenodomus lingam]|uniref:uncharacterized protein n=1 Tax=Leptosphaeria maculans TaxID=5022 RepID=UPI00331F8B2D|nr:hypothetical protein IAQ61_001752 [Plenodomus lingam]